MSQKVPSILLIDDDQIFSYIFNQLHQFSQVSFDITTKASTQQALDYIRANQTHFPDYILVDINLPLADGFQFLDEYHRLYQGQKSEIYMVTTSVYDSDRERALSYPCVKGFFSKPIPDDFFLNLYKQSFQAC